jgi:hypothetical protein
MTAFSKLSGHLLGIGPNSEQSEKTPSESIGTSTVEFNLMYSVKYTVYIRDVPDLLGFLSLLFGALGENSPEIAAEAGCFAGMLAEAGKIRGNSPRNRTETGEESERHRRSFLENRANSRETGKVLWKTYENPHDNAVLERKRISRDGKKCFSGAAAVEDFRGTANKILPERRRCRDNTDNTARRRRYSAVSGKALRETCGHPEKFRRNRETFPVQPETRPHDIGKSL